MPSGVSHKFAKMYGVCAPKKLTTQCKNEIYEAHRSLEVKMYTH